MNLIIILSFIIFFSFLYTKFFYHKIIFIIIPLLILVFYFLIVNKNMLQLSVDYSLDNLHFVDLNHICYSLRHYKLDLDEKFLDATYDLSIYKNKIYSYFGITPVLLFFLPFNLITNQYLNYRILSFIIMCLIFLVSILLFENLIKICDNDNKGKKVIIVHILSVFLIGITPILSIWYSVYSLEVMVSILLVFLSIYILSLYFIFPKKIFIFLLSVSLALSVGARPQNVFIIPAFFIVLMYYDYSTKELKQVMRNVILFLIPCVVYGSLLAIYNYLRFDSIFEFGYWYMPVHSDFSFDFEKLLNGIYYSFFSFPGINYETFFSIKNNLPNANIYEIEGIVGIIYMQPMILCLLLFPFFYKNKKFLYLIFLLVVIVLVNSIITNISAISIRYNIEYSLIMQVFALAMFICLYQKINNRILSYLILTLFIVIYIYSIFINLSICFHYSSLNYDLNNELLSFLLKI